MNTVPEFNSSRAVFAVCGKGGVGKTVFATLLARAMMDAGIKPLLLVDADPVGGLTTAIGEEAQYTLASVKEQFIREVTEKGRDGAKEAAENLSYFIFRALKERANYSLLAMGHTTKKGCFCSANTLLRQSLAEIIDAFAGVIIDAEAGIEQINREVTTLVNQVFVIVDASRRSFDTLKSIASLVDSSRISVVVNRVMEDEVYSLPEGFTYAGSIPEDAILKQYDRDGISLWQLPDKNPVVLSVKKIIHQYNDKTTASFSSSKKH